MALTLLDDMNDIFLDSGFEEEVIYTPSGGVARTINALVWRRGTRQTTRSRTGQPGDTLSRFYEIEIEVSNDSTLGISEVTVMEDTIQLYKDVGDSTRKTMAIAGRVHNDEGNFRFGLKP